MPNHLRAAGPLWSQRQQFNVSPGSLLQEIKICSTRRPHVLRIVCTPVSGLSRKPRPLDVVSANSFFDGWIGSPDPLEIFQLRTKRAYPVCNERQEKPSGFMCGQPIHGKPEVSRRQIALLKIDACNPLTWMSKRLVFIRKGTAV